MSPPITIKIRYDEELRKITGTAECRAIVNVGATFGLVLMSVLAEHPKIAERYPPGMLAFTLNGTRPEVHSLLSDGDTICITGVSALGSAPLRARSGEVEQ